MAAAGLHISLDGEAGPLALGPPELVRLCLVAPWWRDAPGRTVGELQRVADEYREDVPDLDRRRDRAAQALGIDPAGLPSEATVLARLAELSQGPVAEACLVVEPQTGNRALTPRPGRQHPTDPRVVLRQHSHRNPPPRPTNGSSQ